MQNGRMRRIAALLKWKKIRRVSKWFDFLGFHCCPTGMTVSEASLSRRDQKIARLYEQGASKERVGAYLRRWIGWAVVGVTLSGLVGCVSGMNFIKYAGIKSKCNNQYGEILIVGFRDGNQVDRPRGDIMLEDGSFWGNWNILYCKKLTIKD